LSVYRILLLQRKPKLGRTKHSTGPHAARGLDIAGLESDSARNNIHPNNKQKREITNENTNKIIYVNIVSLSESERCFETCRDFHLHFQVLWLTPLV